MGNNRQSRHHPQFNVGGKGRCNQNAVYEIMKGIAYHDHQATAAAVVAVQMAMTEQGRGRCLRRNRLVFGTRAWRVWLCGAGLRGIKPMARRAILLTVQGVHFAVITVTMPPYHQFFQYKKQQQTQQQGAALLTAVKPTTSWLP